MSHVAPHQPDPPPPADALTSEQVRRIAALARLTLTESQVEDYRIRLGAVLAYMQRLHALDLSGLEPMAHVGEAVREAGVRSSTNLAPDEPGPHLPTSALLTMAPQAWESFVQIPKVLGEGGGA